MTRKLIQQFSASRHRKVPATSLFNVRQGHSESLRDYLARFNDTTIKVINTNQEVFVGAFHNGLRAGQFNESLAQKPVDSMEEIIARADCYIKGEENNAEKTTRDVKERASNNMERRAYQPAVNRDRTPYRRTERRPYAPYFYKPRLEDFTSLNTRP
jgi:predicted secreted protein